MAGGYSGIKTICFRCCQEGDRVYQCANEPTPVADQDRVKRRLVVDLLLLRVVDFRQNLQFYSLHTYYQGP